MKDTFKDRICRSKLRMPFYLNPSQCCTTNYEVYDYRYGCMFTGKTFLLDTTFNTVFGKLYF